MNKIYILVSIYHDGTHCSVEGVFTNKLRAIYAKDAHSCASDLTSCRIYEREINGELLFNLLKDRPDNLAYYTDERPQTERIY